MTLRVIDLQRAAGVQLIRGTKPRSPVSDFGPKLPSLFRDSADSIQLGDEAHSLKKPAAKANASHLSQLLYTTDLQDVANGVSTSSKQGGRTESPRTTTADRSDTAEGLRADG